MTEYNYKSLPDENQQSIAIASSKETTKKTDNRNLLFTVGQFRFWSVLFLILSVVTGVVGFFISRSDAGVVGGDAFNYIIGAGRGTALACMAIIFALVSVVLALYEIATLVTYHIQKQD